MRIMAFAPRHFPAFRKMLAESTNLFGAAWKRHMLDLFGGKCKPHNAKRYAALDGSDLIGAFSTRREVETLVLYFIIIGKGQQGRGIGRAIVQEVERMAKKEGAKFVRLDVYQCHDMLGFYEKLGFKPGGRVRYYEEDNDDQIFLYKKV